VPETVLTGVTHTVVRNGRLVAEITAQQVENFPGGGRAVLSDVRYVEYGDDGAVAATGRADRAVYYTGSEDAEVAGAVELRSFSQEASLTAEELHWDHDGRLLSTGPEQVVAVIRDDGSRVQGAGFEAELRDKTINFSGPVSGRLVAETAADE
jgi:LPS export ABC transporter protein LptC